MRGIIGAGESNYIFCQRHTPVIEYIMASPRGQRLNSALYVGYAHAFELPYWAIVSNTSVPGGSYDAIMSSEVFGLALYMRLISRDRVCVMDPGRYTPTAHDTSLYFTAVAHCTTFFHPAQVVDAIALALRESQARNESKHKSEKAVTRELTREGQEASLKSSTRDGSMRATLAKGAARLNHSVFDGYDPSSNALDTVGANESSSPEQQPLEAELLRSSRRAYTVVAEWDSFIANGYNGEWPDYW